MSSQFDSLTSQYQYRTAILDHEVTGRTVHGLAVPFGPPVRIVHPNPKIGSFLERFEAGAFARTIEDRAHKIKLLINHDRKRMPIGKAKTLLETPPGLRAEFDVAETRDGDEVLELVHTGVLDAFSIGFDFIRSREETADDGEPVLVHTEVALREVSIVSFPAYEDAVVAGVRSHASTPTISAAAAQARLRLLDLL